MLNYFPPHRIFLLTLLTLFIGNNFVAGQSVHMPKVSLNLPAFPTIKKAAVTPVKQEVKKESKKEEQKEIKEDEKTEETALASTGYYVGSSTGTLVDDEWEDAETVTTGASQTTTVHTSIPSPTTSAPASQVVQTTPAPTQAPSQSAQTAPTSAPVVEQKKEPEEKHKEERGSSEEHRKNKENK